MTAEHTSQPYTHPGDSDARIRRHRPGVIAGIRRGGGFLATTPIDVYFDWNRPDSSPSRLQVKVRRTGCSAYSLRHDASSDQCGD